MTATARFLLYADGSSLSNPGGPGGTGFVVFDREKSALRYGGKRYERDGEFDVTNNRMELRAVLEGLDGIPQGSTVHLISDSQYTINAVSKWIHGWRKKGWKTAEGKPVLNRDLIEAIDVRTSVLEMKYGWVRGHDGHPVNEIVDALAQSAARGKQGPTKDQVIEALRKTLTASR